MSRKRKAERGFALLLVFLMAAVVALYLYTQLPRVAFESERDKEQSLIDRGEQYKRAIQLYVAAFKKYPQKIEDLENTNDKRFLRQRYLDPMTGKDEWRMIHVNAAGQLTDSLVQKPPCGGLTANPGSATGTASNATPNTTTAPNTTSNVTSGLTSSTGATGAGAPGDCIPAATGALGTNSMVSATGSGTASGTPSGTGNGQNGSNGGGTNDPNSVNAAVLRRPSDVVGQAYTAPANADPNDPSTWAPITLTPATPNSNGQPGGPPSGAVGFNGGLLGQTPAGQTGMNGQGGVPIQPGMTIQGGAPGAGGGFPLPGQPGFNPMQNQFKIDGNGQLVPVTPGQVNNAQTGQNQNTAQPSYGQPYVQPPVPGQPVGPSPFGPQPSGAANAVNPGTGVAPINPATSAIATMLTNPNPTAAGGLGISAGMTAGGNACGFRRSKDRGSVSRFTGRGRNTRNGNSFSRRTSRGRGMGCL